MKKDSENFIKENILLKKETMSLNERISVLDKDMSVFKMKYEDILKNVTKFNKEKKNWMICYHIKRCHIIIIVLDFLKNLHMLVIHIILLWKESLILFQKELRISLYGFLKT